LDVSAWIWGIAGGVLGLLLLLALERLGLAWSRLRLRRDARLFVRDRAAWERRHAAESPTWIRACVDPGGFRVEASPPGMAPWAASGAWSDIERVCVARAGLEGEDELHVFCSGRSGSIVMPLAADGVMDLLEVLVARGLFPRERLVPAVAGPGPKLTCHPE
jgi:hypothetical protein